MLDRPHTVFDAAPDSLGRVAVCTYVCPVSLALVHNGSDLGLRILTSVERIVRREHAARGHDLDVTCAFAQLLPCSFHALICTVRMDREHIPLSSATAIIGGLVHQSEIPMTTGLGQAEATVEEARPLEESVS